MGNLERASVDPGSIAIFKFIIDGKADVRISTDNHQGRTVTFVNTEPSTE
jgi:hypothetical protein